MCTAAALSPEASTASIGETMGNFINDRLLETAAEVMLLMVMKKAKGMYPVE